MHIAFDEITLDSHNKEGHMNPEAVVLDFLEEIEVKMDKMRLSELAVGKKFMNDHGTQFMVTNAKTTDGRVSAVVVGFPSLNHPMGHVFHFPSDFIMDKRRIF